MASGLFVGLFGSSRSRRRAVIALVGSGILLFAGCAGREAQQDAGTSLVDFVNPLGSRQFTVERLLEQGAKGKLGASVKLQGEVVQRSPLLNGMVYQIKDRTGTIWVQSNDAQLEVGQVLTVKGRPVYQEVVLEGLDFGAFYIEEQSRVLANAI